MDFTATALDASGDAVDTDQATLFRVPGGESIVVGGVFTEGHGTKTVELDISNTNRLYSEDSPPVRGKLKTKLKLFGDHYDGQISAKVTSTLPVDTQDAMPVYIIFRDSNGKISGVTKDSPPASLGLGRPELFP